MKAAFQKLGFNVSLAEIRKAISAHDMGKDGTIDFEEFRLFCLENKIPFLLFIDPKGAAKIGDFLSFWNYSNRSIEYKQGDAINMYPIFVCIDTYIRHVSNNQIAIKDISQE